MKTESILKFFLLASVATAAADAEPTGDSTDITTFRVKTDELDDTEYYLGYNADSNNLELTSDSEDRFILTADKYLVLASNPELEFSSADSVISGNELGSGSVPIAWDIYDNVLTNQGQLYACGDSAPYLVSKGELDGEECVPISALTAFDQIVETTEEDEDPDVTEDPD
ncbi:hypothetical protein G210_1215, partial [Candida maltosa Xu316]